MDNYGGWVWRCGGCWQESLSLYVWQQTGRCGRFAAGVRGREDGAGGGSDDGGGGGGGGV